jgi:hypothetical protein
MQWISDHYPENTLTNFQDIIWTTVAFTVTGIPRHTVEQHYRKSKNHLTESESILRSEIALSLKLNEPDSSDYTELKKYYVKLTNKLHIDPQQMLQMWLDARVINRSGKGQLNDKQGEIVDWRRMFAEKIISSQIIDAQKGGLWRGINSSQNIQNTALAILISKEL